MFSLKASHSEVHNTTALLYLMKMGRTGNREMTVWTRKFENLL